MMGYEPCGIPHAFDPTDLPAVEDRAAFLTKIREEAIACHNIAMQRMAKRTHVPRFKLWKAGDKVWLSANHLLTHFPSKKLAAKRHGPFTISKVLSPITYQLKLPSSWRIHPVFHAVELSSYKETEVHSPNFTEPPPDLIDGEAEYEIEVIIAHKKVQGKFQYLVSWKGYASSENSWLPEKEFNHAQEILQTYKKRLRLARLLL